jgi:hypothetical protein
MRHLRLAYRCASHTNGGTGQRPGQAIPGIHFRAVECDYLGHRGSHRDGVHPPSSRPVHRAIPRTPSGQAYWFRSLITGETRELECWHGDLESVSPGGLLSVWSRSQFRPETALSPNCKAVGGGPRGRCRATRLRIPQFRAEPEDYQFLFCPGWSFRSRLFLGGGTGIAPMIPMRTRLITERQSVSRLSDLAREASPSSRYLHPARDEDTKYTVGWGIT